MKKIISIIAVLLWAFQATVAVAVNPYASVMIYDQNATKWGSAPSPITNALPELNIINLTPWDVYIGGQQIANTPCDNLLQGASALNPGATTQAGGYSMPVNSLWLRGTNPNNKTWYQSIKVNLANYNDYWQQPNTQETATSGKDSKAPGTTTFNSFPIVFNSVNGQANASCTAALTFTLLTSNAYYWFQEHMPGDPASEYDALLFGDGVSMNFGVSSNTWAGLTTATSGSETNTYFMTIQGYGSNGAQWTNAQTAFTTGVVSGGFVATEYSQGAKAKAQAELASQGLDSAQESADLNQGIQTYGHVPSVPVTSAALVYPNFSAVVGAQYASGAMNSTVASPINNAPMDLWVFMQSGDYCENTLMFIAVPHGFVPPIKTTSRANTSQ